MKPRPNRHITTIRHKNKITFTQRSTITTFSNKQKDVKQTADNNININISNIVNKKMTINQLHI